jgi:Cu+-exporting ATPase
MTLEAVEFLIDLDDVGQRTVLAQAMAVETRSEHPLARAIVDGLRQRGIDDAACVVTDFRSEPGVGVWAVVDGARIAAGRAADSGMHSGATVIDIVRDDVPVVRLAIRDQPRPEAVAVIAALRELGVRPIIMSGDAADAVQAVAAAVGIDAADAESGVLPADKLARVHELQAAGHSVAMVGDGVNDAAALVAADLGIAMGTGTDAAMEAGDLTIVSGDLRMVPRALDLSRRTLRTIKANLFWAFAYNVAALPLAVMGLMNPVLAGLAMALSSVFVVSNSLRLRR